MTLTSFRFFLFLATGVLVYYIVPRKGQWLVLTGLSTIFYLFSATGYTIVFLVVTTLVTYLSTHWIEAEMEEAHRQSSIIAGIAIFLNVAMWFLLKGSSFWITGSFALNKLNASIPLLSALPLSGALGMGYYTAQTIGYILDVTWRNESAQKNPIKLFLFISFFPQLTVGPISRYRDLEVLWEGHRFTYDNICFGCQRILWGVFKKLVISDRVAILVNGIWNNTDAFNGLWLWVAVLLYPIEIYTDFSGCMDIVLGSAELFDIHLAENFRNPFFARNVQEFWQRWHITLGTWARDYIYYPVLKSKPLIRLGRISKKCFGKRIGKFIPWSIGMGILWFIMGFWHGSVQHIFGVSLWFWTMMVLSELSSPLWEWLINKFEFKTKSFGWHLFQSARTYCVYAVGVVFSRLMVLHRHCNIIDYWENFTDT